MEMHDQPILSLDHNPNHLLAIVTLTKAEAP